MRRWRAIHAIRCGSGSAPARTGRSAGADAAGLARVPPVAAASEIGPGDQLVSASSRGPRGADALGRIRSAAPGGRVRGRGCRVIEGRPGSGRPALAFPTDWIVPDWPLPDSVRALVTTRAGGVSEGSWGAGARRGLNLGVGTGDRAAAVASNRALLEAYLPGPPRWLSLQHGSAVAQAESVGTTPPAADASTAVAPRVVCAVTVADCLPVLLADRSGSVVAAAHAGWRGLAAGIVQATVLAMRRRAGGPIGEILAFLGPGIGPGAFEV